MKEVKVGVFGGTGGVGREIIKVLDDLEFPVKKLSLYAGKSAGMIMDTPYGNIEIGQADHADYTALDLAFWAINADWSKKNRETAKDSGCYIIDNSSAFRLIDDIPLIVPEINGNMLDYDPSRLIANPNCTTAIAAMPLHILDKMAGIEKIIFATYQSASGAGDGGREELLRETRNYLDGKPIGNEIFQHLLPFNLIPHIDRFLDNGYTKEEMKTDLESKKILGLDGSVKISSTCVRVAVERSHALVITAKTQKPVDYDRYRVELEKEPMLRVCDDPKNSIYPMPSNTSGKYPVEVGRIRHPEVWENGVSMFVCGDQLLRGAALNAVLIAKKLYDLGKLYTG